VALALKDAQQSSTSELCYIFTVCSVEALQTLKSMVDICVNFVSDRKCRL